MSAYLDPAQEKLGNGRSMAELMRRGPGGLTGVVVAKATPGGTPENFDPHDANKIQINLVNADGSKTQSLAVRDITAGTVQRAMAVANSRVRGNDIQSIRERAAVAFEELANIAGTHVASQEKVAKPQKPAAAGSDEFQLEAELREELAAPPLEQIDRDYSPMAAFGLKKSGPAPVPRSAAPADKRVSAPQKLVYFEKEGLGTVPAFYHDILVNVTRDDPETPEYSGFIVLVYDLRFEQNAARWFPPSNDPYQRPWAAQIKDDKKLYLVQTTGFQYVYDNKEYCVLNVLRAVIAGSEEAE